MNKLVKQKIKNIRNISIWYCPYYRRFPEYRYHYTNKIDSRIAVSHVNKFVYVRIPKAANSTISSTLYKYQYGKEAENPKVAKDSFFRLSSLSKSQVSLLENSYYKFIFVRNPYIRILSAYLDKVARYNYSNLKYRKSRIRGIKTNDDGNVSFKEFCRYLETGGLYEDAHWIPQSCYAHILGGTHKLDFIGKVENLEADLHQIFSYIYPDHPFSSLSTIKGPDHTYSINKFNEYYDDECKTIISECYKDDFNLFDYKIEL